MVFKQHLVPTVHHLRAVVQDCLRVVVLLRDAWSASHSYCQRTRHEWLRLGVFRHAGYARSKSKHLAWLALRNASHPASLARVFWALHSFAEGWRAMERLWPKLVRIQTYEEMASRGRGAVLEDSLRWWGVRRNNSFVDSFAMLVNSTGGECAKLMQEHVAPVASMAQKAAAAARTMEVTRHEKVDRKDVGSLPPLLPSSATPFLDDMIAFKPRKIAHTCKGNPSRGHNGRTQRWPPALRAR